MLKIALSVYSSFFKREREREREILWKRVETKLR